MKRSLCVALVCVAFVGQVCLADARATFVVNRETGTVSVLAEGKTLLRDARPMLKADGKLTDAGRLRSLSTRQVTVSGLGAGRQQRALYRGDLGDLTLALTQYDGKPYLTARVAFVPSRPLALQELRVFDTGDDGALQFAPPSGMRVLDNGHDLWLDEDVRLVSGDHPCNSNWNHALYNTATGKALVAGFLTNEHAVGLMQTKPKNEWCSWAATGMYDPAKELSAGQALSSELLYLDVTTGDPFAALEGFAAAVAAVLNIKPWPVDDLQADWDSWNTRYHTDITLENMMANARYVARYLKPYGMRWFQIDDGYQRMVGDWYANTNWPGGMKAFADRVHALGLKVAIWVAPFVAHVDSPVIKEHPEWALELNGMLDVRKEWRVLDTSRPEVQRYIEQLCRRYTYEWGFDSFNETDYVYYELLGKKYAVPMTRSEAYRAGVKAIRRGSKPGTFVHGFSAAGLGAGLYDGTRSGDDTGPHWQSGRDSWSWGPKNQAAMSARRYYLNHRVYLLDPDAFYFAHRATLKRWDITEPLWLTTTKAWATLVGITGSMVKVGAAFVDLKPNELAIVRKVLPMSGVSARPLDLFTRQYPRLWQVWATGGDPWQVLAVFDWDEPGESGPLPLGKDVGLEPGREYVAYDFWATTAFTFRAPLTVNPPRRTCILLAIHPELGRPQYLSTDRHVTQGALTLLWERWDDTAHALSGAMQANPDTEQTLVFFLPRVSAASKRATQTPPPHAVVFTGAKVLGTSARSVFPQNGPQTAESKRGAIYEVKLRVTAPKITWRLTFARRPMRRAHG
jgi:hypothetical protein